jgi:hypothetical protein
MIYRLLILLLLKLVEMQGVESPSYFPNYQSLIMCQKFCSPNRSLRNNQAAIALQRYFPKNFYPSLGSALSLKQVRKKSIRKVLKPLGSK